MNFEVLEAEIELKEGIERPDNWDNLVICFSNAFKFSSMLIQRFSVTLAKEAMGSRESLKNSNDNNIMTIN